MNSEQYETPKKYTTEYIYPGVIYQALSDKQEQQICIRVKNLDSQTHQNPGKFSTYQSINISGKISIWDSYRKQNQNLSNVLFRIVKRQNHVQLTNTLQQHAVDVNIYVYMDGWTLLHYACNLNSKSIVEILLQNGANIQAPTNMKRRPLHLAVLNNNYDITKILLDREADANCIDEDFCTPLHYAVSFGYLPIIELLVNCSQDINIHQKNRQQMTVLDCCKDKNIFLMIKDRFKEVNLRGTQNSGFTKLSNNQFISTHTRADYVERFLQNHQKVEQHKFHKKKHSILGSKLKGTNQNKVKAVLRQSLQNLQQILLEEKIQSLSTYDRLRLLGQGSFGKVYLVRKKKSSKKYALKCLSKRKIMQNNLQDYVYMERHVLIKIRNPFVVHAHSFFQNSQYLYMVMEVCLGGDLQKLLNKNGPLEEKVVKMYAAEVVIALGCLHNQGILFRDLKSANVLIDSSGHIKITDFGLAKEASITFSFLGSYAYLAPEMLSEKQTKEHSFAIDWYLLGVLIYQLLTGKPPFFNQNQAIFFNNIRTKKPDLTAPMSLQCKDILSKLLQKRPINRLGNESGMIEVKNHSWFNDIDWNRAQNRQLPVPKPQIDENQLKTRIKMQQQIYWQQQPEKNYFAKWNYYEDLPNIL